MGQPTAYNPAHEFLTDEGANPLFPGSEFDIELNAIETTLDETLANLALIQRADGALANEIVSYDALDPALLAGGIYPLSSWATATAYVQYQVVVQGIALYQCEESHTSGVFATDLTAVKWTLLATLPSADDTLLALGAVVFAADKGLYSTGVDAFSTFTLNAAGRALGGLTAAADKGIYFTSSSAATTFDLTAAGRALLDDADATAQKVTLGLVIGTDVQAHDAELAAIAGVTSAADKVPYFTGSGTAAVADFSSFGRSVVDDANAAAALTTLTARGQGKETIWIPASAMWPRTTNGPAAVARELTTGGDLMVKGWGFDTTTEEGVQFYLAMPKSWDKGTITFQAYWTNVSGLTTETVSWGLSVGAFTNDDPIDTTDLGTEVQVSDTWLAANDMHVTAESGAVTIGNTPIDDDMLIGQVVRSVANDNMTGDAELLGIKIFFTTSAATDA